MAAALNARDYDCSENTVANLVKAHEILAGTPKRLVRTADSTYELPVAQNALDRDFKPSGPNESRCADIRYLATGEGWLSLAAVEGVVDTGEWASVYNFRVSDWHTYFVGCAEWGFDVWGHNTCGDLYHYVPMFTGSRVPRGDPNILTRFLQIGHIEIHISLIRYLAPFGMAHSPTK